MRILALMLASLMSTCTVPAPPEQVIDDPASRPENTVTSILNAGVSAELGERDEGVKFLFDPLYDNHFGSLAELDDALIDRIVNGETPFDGIDAVFVSHAHGDHFSARHLNRMLAAQPSVAVVAPGQAVEAMRQNDLWQDGFADRVTAIELRNGEAAKRFQIAGARIEAIRTPHSGWPDRHADVHNITFRVTSPSGARVMHMGDADPAEQHFVLNSRFFCCARSNLVMVPFWFFREPNADTLIDRTLNAEQAVGMHVPTDVPQFLVGSDREYFTEEGQRVEIRKVP